MGNDSILKKAFDEAMDNEVVYGVDKDAMVKVVKERMVDFLEKQGADVSEEEIDGYIGKALSKIGDKLKDFDFQKKMMND